MSRSDVLHWTPSDYLADFKTKRLDLQEHGAYSLLLWHMWTASESQCEFPLDYRALGAIWGVCPEEAERITDSLTDGRIAVIKVKKKSTGDVLHSKRLSNQAKQANIFRERQSEKGRRSGAVRREKAANHGSTTVQPLLNQTPAQNEPTETRKHVNTEARPARARVREADFKDCYDAYPVHRFKDKARKAWQTAVSEGADPDDLLAAAKRAKRDTTQTLEYFIADGTWRDHLKQARKAACTNPDCDGGIVMVDADTATRCPECNGGAS